MLESETNLDWIPPAGRDSCAGDSDLGSTRLHLLEITYWRLDHFDFFLCFFICWRLDCSWLIGDLIGETRLEILVKFFFGDWIEFESQRWYHGTSEVRARVYSRVRRGHTERLWRSTDQLQHGDIGWELETGDRTGDLSGVETGVGDREGLVRLW